MHCLADVKGRPPAGIRRLHILLHQRPNLAPLPRFASARNANFVKRPQYSRFVILYIFMSGGLVNAKELYDANCCRTAIGSSDGSLKSTPAVDTGVIAAKGVLTGKGLAVVVEKV